MPEKVKKVAVTIISQTGSAALVEWVDKGGVHRSSIPADALQANEIAAELLEAGIPYGVAWEQVQPAQPTGEAIAAALRSAGIWTREDLIQNLPVAIGALQSVYRVDIGALLNHSNKGR